MSIPYLIIGNSTAALRCVEGIRAVDAEGRIVILSREDEPMYARPMISYWLGGKVSDEQMSPVPAGYFERNGVEVRLGVEAVGIDTERREVIAASGERIAFETLLISSGARPIVPPSLGAGGLAGVSSFTTWQDARRVRAAVRDGARTAVVVGGGFIGLMAAKGLVPLGVDVTMVELADRLTPGSLDETASAMVGGALQEAGVSVRCRAAVEGIEAADGRVSGVTLTGGEPLDCDLLVVAIGVTPNAAPAEGSGIELGHGIYVDDYLATSAPGIYAAGDVAQGLDRISGERLPLPLFGSARRQGRAAGRNMAGEPTPYPGGVAMNSLDVFGLPFVGIGAVNPPATGHRVLTALRERKRIYTKLVLRGQRIVGCIMVGHVRRAGVIAHLVQEGIDAAACAERLLEPDFPLDCLPAAYWRTVPGAG